jgi:hypothetical protein
MTSCGKKNADNFGNDSLKKQNINIDWNISVMASKAPSDWAAGFICGTIDATNYKNKDFKFGGLHGTAYAFAIGIEAWNFEAGIYGKFTAGANLSEITITTHSIEPKPANYKIVLEYELFYTDEEDNPHTISDNVTNILNVWIA